MKKMRVFAVLVIPALLIGCAAAQAGEDAQEGAVAIENPYAPQEGDEAWLQDGAMVDGARWDEPAQTLIFSGSLPTPCSQLRATISQNGRQIDFTIYSVSEPEVICAQMLEPFEAAFKMEFFDPQTFRVIINGQEMQL
ncbi:hypothetical protein [Pelolinea submarina]|uniref:META domain-containing protein n=1 Tax=Pelolinea submarina TaxID=913107 RepID=A0A347ZVY8_9CHLR|nr:hypothetical protein [Pelolinea submarina]REG07167.1 hypothetical protein DFR64_2371 [Pelolinea submarina]BBB49469.1 hypothetical protein Pelsub_P2700 [Pelolinea submarina]